MSHPQSHQILMEELIQAGAIDSQVGELDYWQNEIDRIVEKHLAAGLPVEGTGWSVGAQHVAPHDAYEHCDTCCEFERCSERLASQVDRLRDRARHERRARAGRTWETWVGNRD